LGFPNNTIFMPCSWQKSVVMTLLSENPMDSTSTGFGGMGGRGGFFLPQPRGIAKRIQIKILQIPFSTVMIQVI